MAIARSAAFGEVLGQCRLLEPERLAELPQLQARFPEARDLARELVRRGWLTPYQVNQVFRGHGPDLVLGSYVLLERVGEGGMGAVFKAKNWKLGRIVALKLIRKERLANPDLVRRFRREVLAASQLTHPNIVAAYDADEVGGVHFLAMEYVDGIDLAHVVKQRGPLPVAEACAYARQAVLGLQHAHERGLVHRDIKPANLLLNRDGVVKVLDMGLARLEEVSEDAGSTMTKEGAVMGTPDYIAPEQARDSRTADIRADLYSLGCTLYFLLAGRVPFPGGTFMQKINQHQLEEPEPVERLRPEVSGELAAVVRKLMAKRPADRFQTPGDCAAVLADLLAGGRAVAAGAEDRTVPDGRWAAEAGRSAAETPLDFTLMAAATEASAPARPRRPEGRRWLWYNAVGVGLLLGLAAVLVVLLRPAPAPPPPPRDPPAVAAPVKKKDPTFAQWLQQVAELPPEEQVEAVAAKLKERNPSFDGRVTHGIVNGVVVQIGFGGDDVTDLSPVRGLRGLQSLNYTAKNPGQGRLADLTPLAGMRLQELVMYGHIALQDLSPLKGMPLKALSIGFTGVDDLTPLAGMPLTSLTMHNCGVRSLGPLAGTKLVTLNMGGWYSPIDDLTPLAGLPLQQLASYQSHLRDLAPLRGSKLQHLSFGASQVRDLSPLRGIPLIDLGCDFNPWQDTEILRSIRTLQTINGRPAAEVLAQAEATLRTAAEFERRVAALPAAEQVRAVAARLKELNAGFDGRVEPTIAGGVVTALRFAADAVTDLSPVRALVGLRALDCSSAGQGNLADLAPLRGMRLVSLRCAGTAVEDLTPLRGMPLTELDCRRTPVADLTPLRGLPLARLRCPRTPVADLGPLRGMPLTELDIAATSVEDLGPLHGMSLLTFDCTKDGVATLDPLAGMPLETLAADLRPDRDAAVLGGLAALRSVNGRPAAEYRRRADADARAFAAWCARVARLPAGAQVDAVYKKMSERNPEFPGPLLPTVEDGVVTRLECYADRVTDLAPVRALPGLKVLVCNGSQEGRGLLADLAGLRGLKLTRLELNYTRVADLGQLRGMPLEVLECTGTRVRDLGPLRGMRLTALRCGGTRIADLTPLTGMTLKQLEVYNTRVSDLRPLRGSPLETLHCGRTAVEDLGPLRGLPLTVLHAERTPVRDLGPLAGLALKELWCQRTGVTDLAPLAGMPLRELACDCQPERDAALLRSLRALRKVNDRPTREFWKQVADMGFVVPE